MKKVLIGMFALVACAGIAMADVTYCVTVKCTKCREGGKAKVYELMSITGKDQADCEKKAKAYVCGHDASYKKAISAEGYCPKID